MSVCHMSNAICAVQTCAVVRMAEGEQGGTSEGKIEIDNSLHMHVCVSRFGIKDSSFQRIDVCTHLDWLSQKSFLAQVPSFHFGLSHFLQWHTFQTSSFVLLMRR